MTLICKKDLQTEKGYYLFKEGNHYNYYLLGNTEQIYMVYDDYGDATPFFGEQDHYDFLKIDSIFYTVSEYRELQLAKLL